MLRWVGHDRPRPAVYRRNALASIRWRHPRRLRVQRSRLSVSPQQLTLATGEKKGFGVWGFTGRGEMRGLVSRQPLERQAHGYELQPGYQDDGEGLEDEHFCFRLCLSGREKVFGKSDSVGYFVAKAQFPGTQRRARLKHLHSSKHNRMARRTPSPRGRGVDPHPSGNRIMLSASSRGTSSITGAGSVGRMTFPAHRDSRPALHMTASIHPLLRPSRQSPFSRSPISKQTAGQHRRR